MKAFKTGKLRFKELNFDIDLLGFEMMQELDDILRLNTTEAQRESSRIGLTRTPLEIL